MTAELREHHCQQSIKLKHQFGPRSACSGNFLSLEESAALRILKEKKKCSTSIMTMNTQTQACILNKENEQHCDLKETAHSFPQVPIFLLLPLKRKSEIKCVCTFYHVCYRLLKIAGSVVFNILLSSVLLLGQ